MNANLNKDSEVHDSNTICILGRLAAYMIVTSQNDLKNPSFQTSNQT